MKIFNHYLFSTAPVTGHEKTELSTGTSQNIKKFKLRKKKKIKLQYYTE